MIKTGDTIPAADLATMDENGVRRLATDDIFKGKKVVLFAVPGAFTPTCSAKHLPGYVSNAEKFADKGVDTIACMSVNDVFVMDAWGKDQSAGSKVLMLADGNGDFAKAMELDMDARGFGMGLRSQRFALVAKDGVVEQIFVEAPGEFRVSSAEYVLEKL